MLTAMTILIANREAILPAKLGKIASRLLDSPIQPIFIYFHYSILRRYF